VSLASPSLFAFASSDFAALRELYEPWRATAVPAPELLILNYSLAA